MGHITMLQQEKMNTYLTNIITILKLLTAKQYITWLFVMRVITIKSILIY